MALFAEQPLPTLQQVLQGLPIGAPGAKPSCSATKARASSPLISKVKGRKRHLLVDTIGMILHVLVHEANIQDPVGGQQLLKPLKGCLPRLKLIWADSAYKKGGFVEWLKETLGWKVEIVEHPWSGLRRVWAPKDAVIDWEQIRPSGFHVLKWRWIVERTFAWLSTWRRRAFD
jgi:putative transposase